MEFLSRKEIINKPTAIIDREDRYVFMTTTNQLNITKQIYMLHKKSGGILDYLYFRSIIPTLMDRWITKTYIPENSYNMDTIDYLNKRFVKQHPQLYTFKTCDPIEHVVDNNVYKTRLNLGECDDEFKTRVVSKSHGELLAHDYDSIDVWAEQSTEYTNNDMRYRNTVPLWQKSMNTRHYDKDNQGYRSSKDHSSLHTIVSGYGGAFTDLQNKKIAMYEEATTRGPQRDSAPELDVDKTNLFDFNNFD